MPDVDINEKRSQKTPGLARGCARNVGAAAGGAAETGSQDELVCTSELETVATAVENAPPRANETIGNIIARHPCIRRSIVAAAIRALGAKKWWYDAKKKRRVEEPDYALSFKAAEFLADRVDGRPAQAVMNLNVDANATAVAPKTSMRESLEASPAMREAVRRMVDQAEIAARVPSSQ